MSTNKIVVITTLAVVTISGLIYTYQSGYLFPEYLTIFHAGSLSIPLSKIGEQFSRTYPRIRLAYESSGSVDAVRKITDLHKSCDLLAVADYILIPEMTYPDYASWTIIFASNEMVIAYTDKSAHSDEINSDNWYEILSRPDVIVGRADPNKDPCGYRALMVFQLASIYYSDPSINSSLWSHDKTVIRPKSVELLANLESGQIDYAFEYKSVAVQHGLRYVELPDEINLCSWNLREYYAQVNVTIQKGDEKMTVVGAPILYGLTVPKNAGHRDAALSLVRLILGNEGKRIIEECGQNALHPAYADDISKVPQQLRDLVENLPS